MFFLVAPVSQYFNNIVLWDANKNHHTIESYLYADVLLMLFLICFSYGMIKARSKRKLKRPLNKSHNLTNSLSLFIILTVLHTLVFSWFYINIGFPEMLFRKTNLIEIGSASQSFGLVTSKYLKSFSVAIIFILIGNLKNKDFLKKSIVYLNLIIFFLMYFPTSAARFQIIGVFLGLFLFVNKDSLSKHVISNSLIIGLFIVLPILSVFRHVTDFGVINISIINKSLSRGYSNGDFDTYQMFVNCISCVHNTGVTYGHQLLAVFLFFVPRSIWPDKPFGSGHEVANLNSLNFNNLSMPIIGEGYINFGVTGVIIFGFIFGYFCFKYDRYFWSNSNRNTIFIHFYYVFIGYFFFMNRGDLLSSVAFSVALFLAFATVHMISKVFFLNRHN